MVAKKRVYIGGAMSGYEDWNYPAFHAAAEAWRAKGWGVQNPAELGGLDMSQPWTFYMAKDIFILMNCCDAIALLPGWEKSKGARSELFIAKLFGLEIYNAETFERVEQRSATLLIDGAEALILE